MNPAPSYTTKRTIIWLVGVTFLLFQFFLQLSSGVIIGAIMHEQQLSALVAGLLSSAFYYVYTSLQIPVGLLFDRYNTRFLLVLNSFICSLGCFLFAMSYSLTALFCGRLIIGAGSAFAFVGLTRILQKHYPLRQYAFMMGLSETLGFTATVLGMIGMGALITFLSWRYFIGFAGVMGLLISGLCWYFIPDNKPTISDLQEYRKQFIAMLRNKLIWVNGLFLCLSFSVITAFGAMWAVPFIQVKLQSCMQSASILSSMIFLGAGLSCPIYGWLSMHLQKRKPLIHISCLSTALLVLVLMYVPIQSEFVAGLLLFAIGLCCGAYMLVFTIASELTPAESLSACTGFTNTLGMLSAPLLQPFIGYLLDLSNGGTGSYTLADYQFALLVIPIALVMSSVLSQMLPEKDA